MNKSGSTGCLMLLNKEALICKSKMAVFKKLLGRCEFMPLHSQKLCQLIHTYNKEELAANFSTDNFTDMANQIPNVTFLKLIRY